MEFDINLFINAFLAYWQERDKITFHDLETILNLVILLHNQMSKYIKENDFDIDYYKVSKSLLLENERLINNFFKSIGVSFKLDDIIINGVLNIETNSLDEVIQNDKKKKLSDGLNSYTKDKKHKEIHVYNNGLITDSAVWVHEISHYLNQPDYPRFEINDLLTETIAFTEELIYTDYLEKQGYTYEAYQIRKCEIFNFDNSITKLYPIIKLFILYDNLGDTSKESYKMYYGYDEEYDNVTKIFINEITKNQNSIFNYIDYTIAAALSIYMYEEYQKDNSFIEKIKTLNNSLDTKSLIECLNIIGLSGYNEESKNIIKKSIQSYIKSLEIEKEEIVKKELIKIR